MILIVMIGVVLLVAIITVGVLYNHQQKLNSCNKIQDYAARIICIGEQ